MIFVIVLLALLVGYFAPRPKQPVILVRTKVLTNRSGDTPDEAWAPFFAGDKLLFMDGTQKPRAALHLCRTGEHLTLTLVEDSTTDARLDAEFPGWRALALFQMEP